MGPGATAIVGDALTGILGIGGQASANAANARQAQLNREFQERMSSTAWQRGVADMKAAGLNPALAYEKGGASSPSGSTAQMDSVTRGVSSSALQASQIAASNRLADANAAKSQAEARQLELESALRVGELMARIAATKQTTARAVQDMDISLGDFAIRRGDYGMRERMFPANLLGVQIANTKGLLDNEFLRDTLIPRIQAVSLGNESTASQIALNRANTRLASERAPFESFRGDVAGIGSRGLDWWRNQMPKDLISGADAARAWATTFQGWLRELDSSAWGTAKRIGRSKWFR